MNKSINKTNEHLESLDGQDITLILPTRNEELYILNKLETMVDEILDYDDVSLIIADSDSSDETRSRAVNFLSESDLIESRWEVRNYEIIGKSAVLNECLDSIASGIVIISDSDAQVKPGWLEIILDRFTDPEIGAISGIEDADSHKDGFFNSFYRRCSNNLRIKESEIDSTPILEGSILALKGDVLENFRLNSNMNADDTQFSLNGIRNGKRSIVDERIIFTGFEQKRRTLKESIRRAQGIALSLFHNLDLVLYPTRPYIRSILINSIFLYVIFPWAVLALLLTAAVGHLFLELESARINWAIFSAAAILCLSKHGRALFLGIFIIITSHLELFLGKRYNQWEPVRKS